MRERFYNYLLLIFFFIPAQSWAQEHAHDSTLPDTLFVHYSLNDPLFFLEHDSLIWPQDRSGRNGFDPLGEQFLVSSNGVMGAPCQFVWFPAFISEPQTHYLSFVSSPSAYVFQRTNRPWFSSPVAFSMVSYSSGYEREQYFNILHSQPLATKWRLELEYRISNAPGAYKNQRNQLANFSGATQYQSASGKYIFRAGILLNRLFQQENGGLQQTSDFVDTTVYDRQLSDVFLQTASNRFRHNEYFISNEFRPVQNWSLSHVFNVKREYHVFEDTEPLSGYYSQVLTDTSLTHDSTALRSLENALTIANLHARRLRFFASVSHSFDAGYMIENDTSLTQLYIRTGLSYRLSHLHRIVFNAHSLLLASDVNDDRFQVSFVTSDSADWRPAFSLMQKVVSPKYFYSHYSGNHAVVDESFSDATTLFVSGGLGWRNLFFGSFISFTNQHIASNSLGFFQTGKATISGLLLQMSVPFGRFRMAGFGGIQNTSGNPPMRLPAWFFDAEITMKNQVFKKALSLQSGVKVRMNESYYADAYNPYFQTFVRQNNLKTGGFIYPSMFVKAQIKRAFVFAELINFTAGLIPVQYWSVPGYPLPDRGFRFGLTWTFIN